MTPEEIMNFQRRLIKSLLLLTLPSSLNCMAFQLFKYLKSYMGYRTISKKKDLYIKKHKAITISSLEEVKDEAYLEIIN